MNHNDFPDTSHMNSFLIFKRLLVSLYRSFVCLGDDHLKSKRKPYEGVSIISRTGASICIAFAVVQCNAIMSWQSLYKIPHSWVEILIFIFIYLELYIWPDAISQWIQQRYNIKFCANLGQSVTETMAIIR
jgi:hypothetical protein